jgi:hypothetical protein
MDFKQTKPRIVSISKIWNRAEHNALTDLIRFQNHWYCTFRESTRHVYGKDGCIRLIKSSDAQNWESVAFIHENGVDLRDPKLSITPDGHLMLLMGGTSYGVEQTYITRQPRVSFSADGFHWSPLQKILNPHEWLWRITWNKGRAYGVSYRYSDPKHKLNEWLVKLFVSENGLDYQQLIQWDIPGYPNEATIHFLPNGKMMVLLRRGLMYEKRAWIGLSNPPYTDWQWNETEWNFGGPNFIILPDGTCWAGGRITLLNPYGIYPKTALASMTKTGIKPILLLPSGGDCSYPGMVYNDEYLWMSYYSSHEENTAIYLAKIQLS